MNRCPVAYPKEPVDRYELAWWSVQYHSGVEVLRQSATYFVDASWEEAVTEEEREGRPHIVSGAPFKDEWKVYWRGSFCGRNDGWNFYRESGRFDWSNSFATEAEALDAAVMLARDELSATESRVLVLRETLDSLERRAAYKRLTEVRPASPSANQEKER